MPTRCGVRLGGGLIVPPLAPDKVRRVLFSNISLDQRSGTEMFLWDLVRPLSRRGIECAVYTPGAGDLAYAFRDYGVPVYTTPSAGREASPNLYETTADAYLQDHALGEEVFGPLGLIVRVASVEDMARLARGFEGQLTATLHMDAGDLPEARQLLPILERKAGRVLVNGFPTGVEVCDAMVHGGPYPASTNFGATSVGTMAIRRFLRPVSYQNFPEALLPEDLQ